VLQLGEVCCSAKWCEVVYQTKRDLFHRRGDNLGVLPGGAAWCSMLERVAACCSVLQHVAACDSMLQRVAECCKMLQRVVV